MIRAGFIPSGVSSRLQLVGVFFLFWAAAQLAAAEDYGTLVTSEGLFIRDFQLKEMLDEYMPEYHSMLLVFTQCYGGNFLDEFHGRPRTKGLAANAPGLPAYYGGYHDDAARALDPAPGVTSATIHQAGIAGSSPREGPIDTVNTVSLEPVDPDGEIKSRHVLVYAGDPQDADVSDVLEIMVNFSDEANTTVTTVGTGGGGWDYPPTLEGLRDALEEIGEQMNANEQFVLFVTDHGGHSNWAGPATVPAEDSVEVTISTTPETVEVMESTSENDDSTGLFLFLPEPEASLSLSGDDVVLTPNFIDDFSIYDTYSFDLDGDGLLSGTGEGLGLYYKVPEELILGSLDGSGDLTVGLVNNTAGELSFSEVAVESGATPKVGVTDLIANVGVGPNSPDPGSISLDSSNAPLLQAVITNQASTAGMSLTSLSLQVEGDQELVDELSSVSLHHDVNGNGELDSDEALLASAQVGSGGELTFELPAGLELAAGESLTVLVTAGSSADGGTFDVSYTFQAAQSTCGEESLDPFTIEAQVVVREEDGVTFLDVVFPDAPEPVTGMLDTDNWIFSGETPFVDVGSGMRAKEVWEVMFSGEDLAEFSGSATVVYNDANTGTEVCRRVFALEGVAR